MSDTKRCTKGQHDVPHSGFAKNQNTCKACRAEWYARNNYSEGKSCAECGVAIVNKSRHGLCIKHWGAAARGRKPGRTVNHQGYALLTGRYEHPNANKRGQVLEHVAVMSEMLGRPLAKGENVHHINGVRDDNRPVNLELWNTSQPSGQRVPDKVEWAKHILSMYEPDALAQPMPRIVDIRGVA
jgi:hypothetical protein